MLISKENDVFRQKALAKSLNKLPRRQREVIYLRYYNDMNLHEIAEVMNISYQGVSNTLYKAFKALRKNTFLVKISASLLLLAFSLVQFL